MKLTIADLMRLEHKEPGGLVCTFFSWEKVWCKLDSLHYSNEWWQAFNKKRVNI